MEKPPIRRVWIYNHLEGTLKRMRKDSKRLVWHHPSRPLGMVLLKARSTSKPERADAVFWGDTAERAVERSNEYAESRIRILESDIRGWKQTIVELGPDNTVQKKVKSCHQGE